MGNSTYNMGRVVGFSAYESFIKEHDIDPTTFSEEQFITICTMGISSKIEIPKDSWVETRPDSGVYTCILSVPGAVYGAVPVVGLDFTEWHRPEVDEEPLIRKTAMEQQARNIYSCSVCNADGSDVTDASMEGGYLKFCATPAVLDTDIEGVKLIVRGLGIDAIKAQTVYYGPMGLGNLGSNQTEAEDPSAWHLYAFNRQLPKGVGEYVDSLNQPVIDFKTTPPARFYQNQFQDAALTESVAELRLTGDQAAMLVTYSPTDSDGNSITPPALYGGVVSPRAASAGPADRKLYPIDCVAPHTLKMVDGGSISEADVIEMSNVGVHSFFRKSDDFVVKERGYDSENPEDSFELPVADTATLNIYGLRAFVQKQFRFECNGSASQPTNDLLSSVSTVTYIMTVTGYANTEFCKRYQLKSPITGSYATVKEVLSGSGANDPWAKFGNKSGATFSYLTGIPEDDQEKYGVVLVGNDTSEGRASRGISSQLAFVPIRLEDSWLCYSTSNEVDVRCSSTNTGRMSLNFMPDSFDSSWNPVWASGKGNKWDLMGTWWNASKQYDSDDQWTGLVSQTRNRSTEPGTIISAPYLVDHPAYCWKNGELACYQPFHATPKPPEEYEGDWMRWFNTITPLEYFSEAELTSAGIHQDYWDMTMTDFMKAAVIRDLSEEPSDSNYRTDVRKRRWHLFKASDVAAIFDGQSAPITDDQGQNPIWLWYTTTDSKVIWLFADSTFEYTIPRRNIFSPQFLTFSEIPSGVGEEGGWELPAGFTSVEETEEVEYSTQSRLSTSASWYWYKESSLIGSVEYSSSRNALWASKTQTGLHQTAAISLLDHEGDFLALEGTSETVSTGELTWSGLLRALANNQSIIPLIKGLLTLKQQDFSVFSFKFKPIQTIGDEPGWYTYAQLDVSVYNSPSDSSITVAHAVTHAGLNPEHHDLPTDPETGKYQNWFQLFELDSDVALFRDFLVALNAGSPLAPNTNTLRLNISSYPLRIRSGDNTGAPTGSSEISLIGHIDLRESTFGTFILYAKNNDDASRTDHFHLNTTPQLTSEIPDYKATSSGSGVW